MKKINVFFCMTVLLTTVMFMNSCSKEEQIVPKITSVELEHLPTKTVYYVGEEFDVSGLTLKVTYSDNLSKIVVVKKEQVTGFTSTAPNSNLVLQVKESGFLVTFSVSIASNGVQSVSIKHNPSKVVYTLGESLSLEGMALEVAYENGITKEINSVSADMISGFDSSKPSLKQLLKVVVEDKEASLEVSVLPIKVVNNEIVSSVASEVRSFVIPEGITAIKEAAFFDNATVEEVVFPTSLRSIGDEAFDHCLNLKLADLSKTAVVELSNGVFGRTALTTISLPKTLKIVGPMAFYSTRNLKEVTLPDGVEEIGLTAFTNSAIETITIPNTVYSIGRAFYQCDMLKTIRTAGTKTTVSTDKVAKIEGECFNHSANIETLEIPESITTIGISVLGQCKVKHLTLPASVRMLAHNAFGGASSLEEITLKSATKVVASYYPVPSTIKAIKVPAQLVDEYKADQFWKDFADKIIAL
ncbi:leucine-rich repeat domain-containing protein [Bacteroides sp.]|uniref:leucine-rich repeat domain-containing protein n=1 Tax=Bacteroides sp. TaxID=29523 RepID=UPI002FC8185E